MNSEKEFKNLTEYPNIFLKLALQKMYFDYGLGLTNYLKYAVGIFGIGFIVNKNYLLVLFTGFVYAIFCYLLGRWAIKSGWKAAETEVGNLVNPFVKEMREKI